MKRHITIFVFLLAFAATAGAIGFPDDYYGVPVDDGCYPVEAYVTAFLDHEPYSVPDPTGNVYWLGELCVKGGAARLEFDTLAWRRCEGAPWGSPDDPQTCMAWYAAPLHEWHLLAWEGDEYTGFYVAAVWTGEVYLYEALTVYEDGTMRFVLGAFEYDGALWLKESDDYTRLVFDVAPREVQLIGRVPKATARVH